MPTSQASRIRVERIDAITLGTHDMARAVAFYSRLGGQITYGGSQSSFTTFDLGQVKLNLVLEPPEIDWSWWGRIVFHVNDVEEAHREVREAGLKPDGAPQDGPWGERYFHVTDPDGHQLSFARRIESIDSALPRSERSPGVEADVDEASAYSFPASDSPAFTPTTSVSPPPDDRRPPR